MKLRLSQFPVSMKSFHSSGIAAWAPEPARGRPARSRSDAKGGSEFPATHCSCSCCGPEGRTPLRQNTNDRSAFTMVEIALSLAIIAFALVAIIGVLPFGMRVQQENREETIINQDATCFMDAIRNGARGLDDLTNYVFAITNYWTLYGTNMTTLQGRGADGYTATSPQFPLSDGFRIIGLMSRPKYEFFPTTVRSNSVVAFVRALSGSAAEKPPQQDSRVRDLAFSYRLLTEVVPISTFNPGSAYATNLQANLHELRLLFRWPLLANGQPGKRRLAYRTLVSGDVLLTNFAGQELFFFEPRNFVRTP